MCDDRAMPLLEHDRCSDALRIRWRLEATADATWRHLVDRHRLAEWLGVPVRPAATVGDELVVDHGEGTLGRSEIRACEQGRRLALTWDFPDEAESAVEVVLTGDGAVTVLELQHTGLDGLAASYLAGWCTHLAFFEASLAGAPLPTAMFWPLYSTFARLLEPIPPGGPTAR